METIGDILLSKNGHVYVCGDVTMASEVSKTITNLLQEYSALSDDEAKKLMAKLKVKFQILQLPLYPEFFCGFGPNSQS